MPSTHPGVIIRNRPEDAEVKPHLRGFRPRMEPVPVHRTPLQAELLPTPLMSRPLQEISAEQLSRALREARERKGWTLEQLARELWVRGFPASQNKLWQLENKPLNRIDTELLLWLEKVLEMELFGGDDQKQVLIEDVLSPVDAFAAAAPPVPDRNGLRRIHDCLARLLNARA